MVVADPDKERPLAQSGLRLLLVRHGESFNNALMAKPGISREQWEAGRQVDPDLSDLGRQQAEALGRFLACETPGSPQRAKVMPMAMLCVSPVKRALQTLWPTAQKMGLAPNVWADCFEVGGMYHSAGSAGNRGLSRTEMHERFPTCKLPDDVTEEGWYKLDGKESVEQARVRAHSNAHRLWQLAKSWSLNGSLVLLTHHDHLDLLLQAIFKTSDSFVHANTAMTCLDLSADGVATLIFQNCTDHLELSRAEPSSKL